MISDDPTRRYFLNTYVPLVATSAGRAASETHAIPPFVDGSIRREPDLEQPYPSISCLCRAGNFAPRLRASDIVGYMTCKGRYGEPREPHRRLTAVLEVIAVVPSHAEAAHWYRDRDLPLPSNCMVPGNLPKPLAESHRKHRGGRCGLGLRRTPPRQTAHVHAPRFAPHNATPPQSPRRYV
jgi:hypothetical protein